jgi:hypothetical protein
MSARLLWPGGYENSETGHIWVEISMQYLVRMTNLNCRVIASAILGKAVYSDFCFVPSLLSGRAQKGFMGK